MDLKFSYNDLNLEKYNKSFKLIVCIILFLITLLFLLLDIKMEYNLNKKIYADTKMSYNYDDQLTQNQNAIKLVAEQYYNRGMYIQYDDYRKAVGDYIPELATEDNTLYVVCGAFIYDVYRNTYNIKDNLIVNNNLSSSARISAFAENNKNNSTNKSYIIYAEFSDTYKTDFQNFILDYEKNLQVGDVITYLHTSTEGHTMLYIGNGEFIHAGGNSYNLSNKSDRIETSPTAIRKSTISDMYNKKELIFENTNFYSFVVLRPLQNSNLQITNNTAARMSLGNLKINKVSSLGTKVSVNKGDQIRYKITVINKNTTTKVINVNDVVPTNSDFVSCNNCTRTGQNIHWNDVSILTGEKVSFEYTVQVNNTTGTINSSQTNISGISINSIVHQIKPTLSKNNQDILSSSIKTTKPTTFTSIKKLYSEVGVDIEWMKDLSDETINSMFEQMKTNTSTVYKTLVYDYYGGRYFDSPIESTSRDKLYPGKDVTFKNLVIGDLIFVSSFIQNQSSSPYKLSQINGITKNNIYIYVGDNLLYDYNKNTLLNQNDSQTILTSLLGEYKYMVIRPSYNGISSITTNPSDNESEKEENNDNSKETFSSNENNLTEEENIKNPKTLSNSIGNYIIINLILTIFVFIIYVVYKRKYQN